MTLLLTMSALLSCIVNPENPALKHNVVILCKSQYNPVVYQISSLEDMSNMVKQYRERICVAEADAEHSKSTIQAQNWVSPLGTDRL